jgi:hypothetical protein
MHVGAYACFVFTMLTHILTSFLQCKEDILTVILLSCAYMCLCITQAYAHVDCCEAMHVCCCVFFSLRSSLPSVSTNLQLLKHQDSSLDSLM